MSQNDTNFADAFENKTHVDVVEKISYKEFEEKYLSKLKPVIIKNGLGDIEALKKWNVEYLQKNIGNKKVKLERHHNAEFEWSMEEYFEQILNDDYKGPKRYLTQANIVKLFPELLDDLKPYPVYGLPDWKCNRLLPKTMFYDNYQMELLMGKAGTGFFLHYDRGFINAFVGQIHGEKQVVLIPPEDTKHIYANGTPRSDVDIWNLDLEKFPEFKKVRPAFYTLQPGDLVYIPASWWHSTKNNTMSIGVTFNSINKANWSMFSKFIGNVHAETKDKRYPTFVFRTLLAVVGLAENIKHMLFGARPQMPEDEENWK